MPVVVKQLTKFFGETKAVDNLSFEVRSGEVVGFLGPNGAGKTTTMRIITGYISPTGGTVEVNGKDVRKDPYAVRRQIGYLPEENPIYPDMDVIDYLEFVAQLQGVPKKDMPKRIREVITTFNLTDVKHKDIGQLSKGYRQRVGLAHALVHDPPVVILDEPTSGLDPNQVFEFRNFIGRIAKNKTVILSTHALPEVQAVCNRVIIIGKGKMLADSPIADLEKKIRGREVVLLAVERAGGVTVETAQRSLEALENVEAVVPISGSTEGENTMSFYIESRRSIDIRKQIFKLCVDQGWTALNLNKQHVRIDEIFHQLTTGKTTR